MGRKGIRNSCNFKDVTARRVILAIQKRPSNAFRTRWGWGVKCKPDIKSQYESSPIRVKFRSLMNEVNLINTVVYPISSVLRTVAEMRQTR